MAIFKSKAVTKDGRKWYFSVCYLAANGEKKRKKSRLYASRPEAQEAERQFLSSVSQIVCSDITYDELVNQFIIETKKQKESTIYTYEVDYNSHIKGFLNDGCVKVCETTYELIKRWHVYMDNKTYFKSKRDKENNIASKYSIAYKTKVHYAFKTILDFAIKEGYIKENFVERHGSFQERNDEAIENPKIRYHTLEEFSHYESVIDDIVWKSFFNFLFWNAPRKGEQQPGPSGSHLRSPKLRPLGNPGT